MQLEYHSLSESGLLLQGHYKVVYRPLLVTTGTKENTFKHIHSALFSCALTAVICNYWELTDRTRAQSCQT